jgi:hypothetical protein
MGHFAKVLNGKVLQVIVAEKEFFETFVDSSPGEWIQTSYNTRGNRHILGGTPLRANYAYIGGDYDSVNDVFYQPQPFPSWTISAPTWTWTAPVPYPNDGGVYDWNETTKQWVKVA